VLAIAVHDAKRVGLCAEQTLNGSLGEAAIFYSQDGAYPLVLKCNGTRNLYGAVERIIVDKDDLPVDVAEGGVKVGHQRSDVLRTWVASSRLAPGSPDVYFNGRQLMATIFCVFPALPSQPRRLAWP
jgi:hypothetical protein